MADGRFRRIIVLGPDRTNDKRPMLLLENGTKEMIVMIIFSFHSNNKTETGHTVQLPKTVNFRLRVKAPKICRRTGSGNEELHHITLTMNALIASYGTATSSTLISASLTSETSPDASQSQAG